jgi:hypothetical protein
MNSNTIENDKNFKPNIERDTNKVELYQHMDVELFKKENHEFVIFFPETKHPSTWAEFIREELLLNEGSVKFYTYSLEFIRLVNKLYSDVILYDTYYSKKMEKFITREMDHNQLTYSLGRKDDETTFRS